MSDNIPFEIQMEIIKKVSDVKSLIQFRSVSKQWKAFIDSSEFINGYGARHTQPHSRILCYKSSLEDTCKYIYLVDDDIETFKVQKEFVASPLLKQYRFSFVVGACHGLLCLYAFDSFMTNGMFVIWNPSIQKSVGILDLSPAPFMGFGVCPVTRDPTIVKILCEDNKPWHVEVFTLSSGVWNVIPSANLPRQSIRLNPTSTQVVIDRFIYWGAREKTFRDDGKPTMNHMVVSFDLITKEFKVVDLLDTLTNELFLPVSVSKLRGSLVVSGNNNAEEALCCGIWMMEHDSSFRKLFTIGAHVSKILGFSKSGETIFVIRKEGLRLTSTTLNVYDPYSQQIKNLGISGVEGSFFMGSYKESLLLLDHSDLHIYSDDS